MGISTSNFGLKRELKQGEPFMDMLHGESGIKYQYAFFKLPSGKLVLAKKITESQYNSALIETVFTSVKTTFLADNHGTSFEGLLQLKPKIYNAIKAVLGDSVGFDGGLIGTVNAALTGTSPIGVFTDGYGVVTLDEPGEELTDLEKLAASIEKGNTATAPTTATASGTFLDKTKAFFTKNYIVIGIVAVVGFVFWKPIKKALKIK